MKNQIWAIALMLLMCQVMSAQKSHTVKLSSADKKISFTLENYDVKIETHASNEIIFETEREYKVPDRAKGLKRIYNGTTDNTGMALNISKSNGEVVVKKASNRDMSYIVKIPKSLNVYIHQNGWRSCDVNIANVTGEIEIKATSADLHLENVKGPMVLNNTNGDIEIIMSNEVSSNPSAISSINGDIDVAVPASMKADLKISTMNGDLYSDVDIKPTTDKEKLKKVSKKTTIGTINNGGVELSMRSINGNIYLRKK